MPLILSFRICQSSVKTKHGAVDVGVQRQEIARAFWENTMRSRFVTFLFVLSVAFFGSPTARAQMTVDFAKVTCKQFVASKYARPKSIAYWLSGYYNGKNSNTSVDIREMEQNVHKLETYCRRNYEMPVMDAAKNVLSVEK
jgi:acid stress chaperone HdeB